MTDCIRTNSIPEVNKNLNQSSFYTTKVGLVFQLFLTRKKNLMDADFKVFKLNTVLNNQHSHAPSHRDTNA